MNEPTIFIFVSYIDILASDWVTVGARHSCRTRRAIHACNFTLHPRSVSRVIWSKNHFRPYYSFTSKWTIAGTHNVDRSRHSQFRSDRCGSRTPHFAMVPSQTRTACEKQRRELTRKSACTIFLLTATILCASAIRKRVRRPAAVRRQRCPFETVVQYLSPHDFTRYFRMPRNVFYKLLSLLEPRLMRNASMGRRSSGGIIEPAVRLAIFLQILSGASYRYLELAFHVGRSRRPCLFNGLSRPLSWSSRRDCRKL
jgi:hypothetical protein